MNDTIRTVLFTYTALALAVGYAVVITILLDYISIWLGVLALVTLPLFAIGAQRVLERIDDHMDNWT